MGRPRRPRQRAWGRAWHGALGGSALAALGLVGGAAPLAAAAPDAAVVVERVLAVVDGVPVLLSEVQLVEALRGVDREAALRAVIDERLMVQEAARLARAAVTPEEAEAAYRSLLAASPAAAGLPEAGVRRLVRRQAAILKYVEFRFRPQVRVSEDDVRSAYERSARAGDGRPFEAVAEELRERLARERLDEQVEAWVAGLREAADVRINPPPTSP